MVSSTVSHDLKVGEYTARELMEARPHIEIPAAGWAAERRSAEDLRQLTELTQAMAAESNQTDWVALDGQFHLAITRASGNRVFQNALVNIRNSLTAQSATLNLATGRMRRSNEEHERIVEAISSGDRQAAERAMADHLDAVQVAVRSLTH